MHTTLHVNTRRGVTRLLCVTIPTALLLLLTLAFLVSSDTLAESRKAGELVEFISYENTEFFQFSPNPTELNQAKTKTFLLPVPYTGTVTEAQLLLATNNVDRDYFPILVNGESIGMVQMGGPRECDPTVITEYPITPALLHSGTNSLTLTQEPSSDSWNVCYMAIRVRGEDLTGSDFVDIQFPGENDQPVDALLLNPRDQIEPRPLLVLFHGWKGLLVDPYLTDYTSAAVSRRWFVGSPQQRGNNALGPGGQPLASLRSQHDAIKFIEYMQAHYPIDPDRIYVGGFSMGGMTAGVVAEKHPDIFAAVVTHKAIGNLTDWFNEQGEYRQTQIISETGGAPWEVPFEYKRRSPVEMASNVKNLPIAVVHGISDTVVHPQQAQDFYDAIVAADPRHAELQWYAGDHPDATLPYGGEWAAQFMEGYTRLDNPAGLRLRTDESKAFYWLDITKRSQNRFTEVDVDVDAPGERFWGETNDSRTIDLTFDLGRMGLIPNVTYVYSRTNSQETTVEGVAPSNGVLRLSMAAGQTQFEVYRGDLPVVRTLKNGEQGYNGTTDTWIDAWHVDDSYGDQPALILRPDNVGKAFIRFDLQDLPDDIVITAATLKLYDNGSGPDMTVNLHRMLRPWDEATATYNQAASGQPWSVPGGAAGADWESAPLATFYLDNEIGYKSINLLSAVGDWVEHPENNHGVALIVASAGWNGAHSLQSSEHWDLNVRPKLKLIFEPIPPTPTPTPTPTLTPTSTPTPTVTPTSTPTATPTPALGDLAGIVYEDINGDYQYQPGEPPLAGATVQLWRHSTLLAEQTTGSDGVYAFESLLEGSYTVQESAPPGYYPAKPTDTAILSVSGGEVNGVDFGHQPRPDMLYLPMTLK
ncbi:MAG TPA: alpha/beta fold hydrolase [Caldilineae bacterium]|nr:alpha/beta fold hydrolase [Caldilineae bacterium]